MGPTGFFPFVCVEGVELTSAFTVSSTVGGFSLGATEFCGSHSETEKLLVAIFLGGLPGLRRGELGERIIRSCVILFPTPLEIKKRGIIISVRGGVENRRYTRMR